MTEFDLVTTAFFAGIGFALGEWIFAWIALAFTSTIYAPHKKTND